VDAPVQAPDDFASFVAQYAERVRAACATLTGNDRLAATVQQELFASVALRWWWLRRQPPKPLARPGAAAAYLQRQLRREAANWRPEDVRAPAPDLTVGLRRGESVPRTQAIAELATNAWDKAHRIRIRRRRVGVIALVAIAIAAIALPRTSAGRQNPDVTTEESPLPTAVPASVDIARPFDELSTLPTRSTPLPPTLNMDANLATPLIESPIPRARAVAQLETGPLIIAGDDGITRKVDDSQLSGAELVSTSLSPDGSRVALATTTGLLVVDLSTAAVRPIRLASAAGSSIGTLVWRTNRTVLVPARTGAQVVNVDTGQTTNLSGLSGTNVITMQGAGTPTTPVELVPSNPSGAQPARIRIWRAEPSGTPGPNGLAPVAPTATPTPTAATTTPPASAPASTPPTSTPSAGASPTADTNAVEDRPIFGPPWIGRWGGAGWGNEKVFARPCDPSTLALPENVGVVREAVGAVDGNGLYSRTLATVEGGVRLDALGFLDPQTLLVSLSKSSRTWVVSWDTHSGDVRSVTQVNADVRVSVADLLRL